MSAGRSSSCGPRSSRATAADRSSSPMARSVAWSSQRRRQTRTSVTPSPPPRCPTPSGARSAGPGQSTPETASADRPPTGCRAVRWHRYPPDDLTTPSRPWRHDPMTDAERPSDPAKRHSAAITDGPDRAGARAMLKAVGFTDEDLAKPIVGVGTTWIETMPCNLNQRRLAEHVKAGIRAAGGTPMEFNTVAISDGVTMGTEGMKTSLVSREVVADSMELVTMGQMFDGLVALVACDKTVPAA